MVLPDKIQSPEIFIIIASSPDILTILFEYILFTYGSNINDDNLFLVSNYCFSEIEHNHQMQYIAKLFPKVSHGFMVWNRIIVYNFGFTVKEELEYPLTGAWNGNKNKYIYF